MTPAEEDPYIRCLVDTAPPLNPQQRLHLAALLRPDLPVGIRKETGGANEKQAS